MNKAILIGNLTKDPELRTTPQGTSVCTFRIAVSRPYKRDATDFMNIVAWRGLAENCAKFLAKGRKVGVVGYIQTREYDDNNGQRRYVTEIIADDVEFLTPRGEGGGGYSRGQDVPPPPDDAGLFGDEPDDFEPLDDEQMPF